MVLHICTVPSGKVPGGGPNGRALKIQFKIDGEGSDDNLHLQIRVLFVELESSFLFSYIHEILFVKCNPTADN
jgi:hypothetical protein